MYISDSSRRFRRLTANVFLCATMILIITPSVVIIPIRYLLDLESKSGPIQPDRELVGVAVPALALFLVNTIILPWLIQISADFQREFLRSDRERSILAKNALFLFFNALLLPTFSLNSISSIIDSKYVEHLGDWERQIGVLFMSSGGQFFMVYLVHAALLGSAAELLNFTGAFWRWIYRHTSITREEFQRIHMTPSYDCGYNLAYQLTMFGLALTYSTAVPLLLPFALFYFVVHNLVTWHLIENNLRVVDNNRLNNIVPSLSLYLFIYCIIFQVTVACILVIQNHPALYACGMLMFVFVAITVAITIWSRQWSQSALLAAITADHDQSFPTAYRHPLLRTHRLDYDCDL